MASILATCVRESIIAELASSEKLRGISKALELQHLAIPARTLEKRDLEYSLQIKLASDCMKKFHPNWEYFSQQKHHHLHFLVFHLAPKGSLFR